MHKKNLMCAFWAGLLINFCGYEAFALPKLDFECRSRVDILSNYLNQALHVNRYPKKKRSAVKNAIIKAELNNSKFEIFISSLRELTRKDNINNSEAVSCLLSTGAMVQKLHAVALAGGTDLDHFSTMWKEFFPTYARNMGYYI